MAMSTPADFIKAAMRKHGALRLGKNPTNDQYANFLDALNVMLRGWSTEPNLQAVQYTRTDTWTGGTASKTLGPSGADITNARPIKFLPGCSFKDTAAGIVYPVEIIPKTQYDEISVPATLGIPMQLFCQWGLTNWTLIPWYVPASTMQLRLNTLEPISEYTAVTNPIGLPIEYHPALLFNLTLEIADDLGRQPSRHMILRAAEEKEKIKALHSTPPPRADVAAMLRVSSDHRFNIYDGGISR